MRNLDISLLITAICILTAVLFSGCIQKTSLSQKILIERGKDDGSVYVLANQYPDNLFGFANDASDGVFVGVVVSGGRDTIISRALYRFNISQWRGEDVIFHGHCTYKRGDPGKIEIYVIDDFGDLSKLEGTNPMDVSGIWNLVDMGTKIAEIEPTQGKWFEVKLPKDKIKGNYLSLMLKLQNEEKEGYNAYALATYEYAKGRNEDVPYLTLKK